MSDERRLLADAVTAVLARHDDDRLWPALLDTGFAGVGVPEDAGGSGGGLADAVTVVRAIARAGRSTPVAEHLVAGSVLSVAGLPAVPGRATAFVDHGRIAVTGGHRISGVANGVPCARGAAGAVLLLRGRASATAAVVAPDAFTMAASGGRNVAGEPRDVVHFDGDAVVAPLDPAQADRLEALAAFVRGVQIAGACEAVLELTLAHVKGRHQFGRPLGRFQAVKQHVASLAAEVAAANAAIEGALAADGRPGSAFELLAARLRCSIAATRVAAIAHQLHGAVGTTAEHRLHRFTTSLWSWRDEYGTEPEIESRLAGIIGRRGRALWPLLTGSAAADELASSPP